MVLTQWKLYMGISKNPVSEVVSENNRLSLTPLGFLWTNDEIFDFNIYYNIVNLFPGVQNYLQLRDLPYFKSTTHQKRK